MADSSSSKGTNPGVSFVPTSPEMQAFLRVPQRFDEQEVSRQEKGIFFLPTKIAS
jgi:hypothetical protein